jgi:hypothetical protein
MTVLLLPFFLKRLPYDRGKLFIAPVVGNAGLNTTGKCISVTGANYDEPDKKIKRGDNTRKL